MTDWHILIVTRGGSVSLLKNLTADVARETMQRLAPYWMRPEFNNPSSGTGFHHCRDGDIEKLEAFGPEGVELEVWPDSEKVKSAKPVQASAPPNR